MPNNETRAAELGGGHMKVLRILGSAGLLLLAGCASSIAYRADYVPDRPIPASEQIDGRVLVYTTRADDERLVTGGATSFTGSGAKLTVPVGMMVREIAVKVFSKAASLGAVASNDLNDAAHYSLVVRPEVQEFKYGFPQLKNLGFAITPQVEVRLRVSVLDSDGKPQFEREFASGVVEGKSYMMSGQPYERINHLAHETIYDLLNKAAADVRSHVGAAPAPSPAEPMAPAAPAPP
jgi:hypothetical protein